jgi:hypothetical protein
MYFAALLIVASTLVMRSGERIAIEGPVTEKNGVVVFRSGGALYSMPATEVDETATRTANDTGEDARQPARRLKVTAAERQRLLRDLETNHSAGQAPADFKSPDGPPAREPSSTSSDPEEWNWRQRARAYEESVRQAKENLDLLVNRADQLRSEIRGLLSLGWKPQSFTYQTTQLAYAEDAIPGAELSVTRAERAYDQFREDARRMGVMPGWLR